MPILFKLFRCSAVTMGLCAMVCAANAATARNSATVRSGARMPSMPTLPLNSVGNLSQNVSGNNNAVVPDEPVVPDDPVVPDEPVVPDDPVVSECPDGGVKNSEYTVENCMNDVLNCINNGALPNGLNDLFNVDLRNSIVNGMGVCRAQVEKCVSDVRRDCANVYRSFADVWIDFNTRKVQPEYYNFVLRKTGLTPYQAENTCRLLDKNTYGPSFAAVANDGRTTAEYNQTVGAYNNQNGNVLIKNAPQGVKVNDGNPGVDGSRGHYARWDATTATCYLRVAAYNKDKHISNSWLFGAVGDDRPAEVWKAAGDMFNCNKDLFGFSLMKDTSTVAVVGVGGGTVLGAGVGAIAGHGKRDFDCSHNSQLKTLSEQLRATGKVGVLNQFLMANHISTIGADVTQAQCQEVLELYNVYNEYADAIARCEAMQYTEEEVVATVKITITDTYKEELPVDCDGNPVIRGKKVNVEDYLAEWKLNEADIDRVKQTIAAQLAETEPGNCYFKPLNQAKIAGTGVYCSALGNGCLNHDEIRREIEPLGEIFAQLPILQGEKSNMGKSIGIGAAVGAGTGGLATAITAFVERNNINCRVGDGLAQVGFNKSHSIDTLKDFYVKWNLKLPETIAPTAAVNDCQSWKNTCAMFTNLEQCTQAQFNYKPTGAATTTLVHGACAVSGSVCIENWAVAKSFGACSE